MGQASYMASPTWLLASDTDEALRSTAGRHRSVRLRGLQAQRVLQDDEEPELLEQAVPVSRRRRVPPDPRRLSRRERARRAAPIDLLHSTNGETIAEFRDDQRVPHAEITNTAETGYTLLHVTQEGSPLQRRPCPLCTCVRVRRAGDHRLRSLPASASLLRPVLARPGRLPGGNTATRWHKTWPRHRT